MGNTNGEKVAAILREWAFATDIDHELMAQIAINVLTDWDKRDWSERPVIGLGEL